MGKPHFPLPVNLIVGMLSRYQDLFEEAEERLQGEFGPIDLRSEVLPFDFTDYYEEEMGKDILRKFLSFERLIDPGSIASIKLLTNTMEEDFRKVKASVGRPLNLDPGYIGGSKLVLATTKDYSHRVYLGEGIHAEVTLRFTRGSFEPMPWTYPDYRTENYLSFFSQVRSSYLEKLKRQPIGAVMENRSRGN
ncbi:MAG TPA: DUF4416 family protein [Candidatus Hypogeohydataceae bacterium YC38]|nr:DUF4416 family protein [Candidatus Brocadiales bacterium]